MVLVMIGAFTKSAQVPFYIWLPDAMEAPTPVTFIQLQWLKLDCI